MRKYLKMDLAKKVGDAIPKRTFELSDRQISKLRNTAEVLLVLSAVAGLATVAVIAPNALQLINKLPWARKTFRSLVTKNRDQKKVLTRAVYYIRQNNYVELVPKGDDVQIKITEKGKQKLKEINLKNLSVPKQKWDGMWWFVLADIPTEPHRADADRLRKKLKEMGFYFMQRTVWVYPFDPRGEIEFIATHYGIGQYITMLQASAVDQEDERNFKLWFKGLNILR